MFDSICQQSEYLNSWYEDGRSAANLEQFGQKLDPPSDIAIILEKFLQSL